MRTTESAVAIARAHVEAWSNHDFDAAREALAADVLVTAAATNLPCRRRGFPAWTST
jgi:hypothetical protein